MSTRATAARHVRQRKLNTKQPLRIFREHEINETPDDESQRNIPHVETGVEKGEEIEYHLQAVINASNAAALGAKAVKQSYIPVPETIKAKGVKYDELYPKAFSQPATYIRFSSTVEDSVGVPYCMNDEDYECLAKLNDGKDVNDQPRKDKLGQCSDDLFEEVMSFFEEATARLQPFATVDSATPVLTLDEMERAIDDTISAEGQKWLRLIYEYWESKKGSRPMMPSIKVRMLDTSTEVDDTDPYVCFRRREVRQTRKTRGRDAQVVEKLKKLRLELEQARALVQMVVQREQLNKEDLEMSRTVFDERKKLKDVKVNKNIIGEKGEDEELLVNQKPAPKPKSRQETGRPPTIRLRSTGDRSAPEDELRQLSDIQAEADAEVQRTIDERKAQHKRWNQQWVDETWRPITPPLEDGEEKPKWAPLLPPTASYPTPPPTLPSESSNEREEDVEMQDRPATKEEDADAGAIPEPDFVFHIPGAYPVDEEPFPVVKRESAPACRLRYGRGGRCWLEARRKRPFALISTGVVSDSESDDEDTPQFFPVSPHKVFDLRCNFISSSRPRPEGMSGDRRQWPSGDQSAMAGASGQRPPQLQQKASSGGG